MSGRKPIRFQPQNYDGRDFSENEIDAQDYLESGRRGRPLYYEVTGKPYIGDDKEMDSGTDDIFDFGPRRALPEKLFKVIIIGDPTVGKTSFIQRYVQNSFSREYKGTVGVDFALKVLHWYDSQVVKLQLWDIAGQERFTWMTRVYYKDAHGCVIMFDLTNKNSFENTLKWKKDLDAKCSLADGSPVPCMLLANKCDLQDRKINQAEIEAFHKENNFIGWTETSAKEGLMVNDSMRFLVEVMMQQEGLNNSFDSTNNSLYLTAQEPKKEKKCYC